jgi:hypothetical protein
MPRRGKRGDAIPEVVMNMAKEQAKHIEAVLEEAGASEEGREARLKACPSSRRELLMELLDKERAEDKLKITRLREDHAMLLDRSLRDHRDAVLSEQVELRHAGTFVPEGTGVPGLYADKKIPDKPGTTAQVKANEILYFWCPFPTSPKTLIESNQHTHTLFANLFVCCW